MYTDDPTWSSISGLPVQAFSSIAVAPTTYTVPAGSTYPFKATALDQNGVAMNPQPTFTWGVSGGGTINSSGVFTAGSTTGGPYTITASSGGFSATASVNVVSSIGQTSSSGTDFTLASGKMYLNEVTLAAPAVIQSLSLWIKSRSVTTSLVSMGLYSKTSSTTGTLLAQTAVFNPFAGWNTQNVVTPVTLPAGTYYLAINMYNINNSAVLNTKLVTGSGGTTFCVTNSGPGVPPPFPTTFTTNGCAVSLTSGQTNSFASMYASLNAPANTAPTVATAAAASSNPMTTTTAALRALGADDGGEGALTYTWSVTSAPSGATVSFSENGTNSAKSTVATFSTAGSYTLQVTMTDIGGLTTTSSVTVTANVGQTASSVTVDPYGGNVSLAAGGQTQFRAVVKDQFGVALNTQPAITWTTSGGGTINASGLFTGTTVGGPYTITAASGSLSNYATWSVVP
jgi:hypothetical protein